MIAFLHAGEPGSVESRVCKVARFAGLEIAPLTLSDVLEAAGAPPRQGPDVVCSAQALASLCQHGLTPKQLADLLEHFAHRLFVFGFEPTPEHAALLGALSHESLLGVSSVNRPFSSYRIVPESRAICGQFSGLSFDHQPARPDRTFIPRDANSMSSLITVDDRPFFVHASEDNCQVFLSAAPEVPDLDAPIGVVDHGNRTTSLLRFFSTLAPLLMFLRAGSADAYWHNEHPLASIVIDDPLLRPRYGFVDYAELLRRMQIERFACCLAFIPWNHDRSDAGVVRLLSPHPDHFSLCVHGCDHTWGEFESTDGHHLRTQARRGFERMKAHERRFGIKCEPVMVFPQGLFTTAALEAIKDTGYLAAANSSPFPVDRPTLPLRSLLGVALVDFDLPIFARREPAKIAEFAFDLFLGKPAIVVTHHDFFEAEHQRLSQLLQGLRSIEPNLAWASLETIFSRAHLKRTASNGETHIRFYTERFVLENPTPRPQRFVLERHAPSSSASTVTVDRQSVSASQEDGFLRFPVALEAGKSASVHVASAMARVDEPAPKRAAAYETGVFLRRHLAEIKASVSASWLSLVIKRSGLIK